MRRLTKLLRLPVLPVTHGLDPWLMIAAPIKLWAFNVNLDMEKELDHQQEQ